MCLLIDFCMVFYQKSLSSIYTTLPHYQGWGVDVQIGQDHSLSNIAVFDTVITPLCDHNSGQPKGILLMATSEFGVRSKTVFIQ